METRLIILLYKFVIFLKRRNKGKFLNWLDRISLSQTALDAKISFYKNKINDILSQKETFELIIPNDREIFENYKAQYSALDRLGPILFKDNKVYRGIYQSEVNRFKKLYESGLLQLLAKFNMIPHVSISNYCTKDFPLIIEIEKIMDFPDNCFCDETTLDAIILTLEINLISNHFGYKLHDGHLGNVKLHKGRPIFVDIGSFVVNDYEDFSTKQLVSSALLPLLCKCFKNCTYSCPETVGYRSFPTLSILNYAKKFHKRHSSKAYNFIFNEVFFNENVKPEYVSLLFPQNKISTIWGCYNSSSLHFDFKNPQGRFKRIIELIEQYSKSAKSAFDFAGNSGYFMHCLENSEHKYDYLINNDYDLTAIKDGYEFTKNSNSEIYNSKFDFMWENIFNIKADAVFALALTHHLILSQGLNLDFILNRIKKQTNKYAYIEFCPLGLYYQGQEFVPQIPDFYTQEWFEEEFKKHFKLLHKEVVATVEIDSKEFPHRVLFIGEIL